MTNKIAHILIAILILLTNNAIAQDEDSTHGFAARSQIIFYDDLSTDTLNHFPTGWRLCVCNANKYAFNNKYCSVQRADTEQCMIIRTDPNYTTNIEPDLNPNTYLNDSFTLEYDFLLGSEVTSMEMAFHIKGNDCLGIAFSLYDQDDKGFVLENEGVFPKEDENSPNHIKSTALLPDVFNYKGWHHFALDYNRKSMKCYVDGKRIMYIPDCHYHPSSFSLSSRILDVVKYKNIRIATGEKTRVFDAILSNKKFITHSIHFDMGLSAINRESLSFIDELAAWLRAHPKVKIEIDGHTDSDGNGAANLKLSKARADEVKKQLVALGVDARMLITKGYGASKPLQPNTTFAGKRENRRVEFIKQ